MRLLSDSILFSLYSFELSLGSVEWPFFLKLLTISFDIFSDFYSLVVIYFVIFCLTIDYWTGTGCIFIYEVCELSKAAFETDA